MSLNPSFRPHAKPSRKMVRRPHVERRCATMTHYYGIPTASMPRLSCARPGVRCTAISPWRGRARCASVAEICSMPLPRMSAIYERIFTLFHNMRLVEKGRRKVEARSLSGKPVPARLLANPSERYPEKPERYPDTSERYPDCGGTLSRVPMGSCPQLVQFLRQILGTRVIVALQHPQIAMSRHGRQFQHIGKLVS